LKRPQTAVDLMIAFGAAVLSSALITAVHMIDVRAQARQAEAEVAALSDDLPRIQPRRAATQPRPPLDCTKMPCVALTFDDGPSPMTQPLLDALASRGVKATFFVQGYRAAARPGDIAAIVAAGHVVGNHAYNHPRFKGKGVNFVIGQLRSADAAIVAAGAPRPTFMRSPYGERTKAQAQAAARLGLVNVLWNVDPNDWANPGADVVVQRVLSAAKPGAIILMHDMHQGTVDALPQIIDGLRAAGYLLVTVPQLIGDKVAPGTNVFSGPKG